MKTKNTAKLLWFVRTRWLIFLFFVCIASYCAKDPGYVLHPDSAPYPWLGLCVISAFLGILCVILHAILRSEAEQRSWRRLLAALLFVFVILAYCVLAGATDQPGLVYVPLWFSLSTFLLLSFYALAWGIAFLWKNARIRLFHSERKHHG